MKLIATIRNYRSPVKSNPYTVQVHLDGRPIWEKTFRTVKKCEDAIEAEFGGAEIVQDLISKRENKTLYKKVVTKLSI